METPTPLAAAPDNVEVPPHPGRIGSHPRINRPSICLQVQQPGDQNRDPPGPYRPAVCGNPSPTSRLLIGWGSLSQRAARVAPRDNVDVLPHPGRIGSHLRIKNLPKSLQLQQAGDENGDPPGQYYPARCGNPNPTGLLLISWGSMNQREASVAPLDNVEVPSHPGRIGSCPPMITPSLSTPATRGRKRRFSGSIPPCTVWNTKPHWLVADWLGLMEPAAGEGCPSGQG